MAVLKVAQIGQPAIYQPAVVIEAEQIAALAIASLVSDMVKTKRDNGGVGLAAPQVRIPLRAIVMEIGPSERYPDREPLPLHIVLNPVITALGPDLEDDWEGCLSIVGLRGQVPRLRPIRLQGTTPEGHPLGVLHGFAARVAQHEVEHLDGMVFLDHMSDLTSLTAREEFSRTCADWPPAPDRELEANESIEEDQCQ